MTAPDENNHQRLNRQVITSLEQSLDQLDQATLAQLASNREHALARGTKRGRQPLWAASAAAVLVLLGLPLFFSTQPKDADLPPEALATLPADYYSVDPEMLEVLDMLIALGELAEEDASGL